MIKNHLGKIMSEKSDLLKEVTLTEQKKIVLDYTQETIKLLQDKKIKFEIYKVCFYQLRSQQG